MQELAQLAGTQAAQGRGILAHQGNGASLAAVRGGRSIDTGMAFTPSVGLPMGTRTGDLDPGVAWYLMQSENLTPEQFNRLINPESGLLGVSETSSDMGDLIRNEAPTYAQPKRSSCFATRSGNGSLPTRRCWADSTHVGVRGRGRRNPSAAS
jgi:acetate kinase